jgi:hypothetical protein
MQYIFTLAKPLLWPHVRRHGGVDLTYEYLSFPAVVAVVGHIANTVCTSSIGGMVEPRKFPIWAKMSVQVHAQAGLFLRKEPTAPLDKRDWLSTRDGSPPTEICCGRIVPSQLSTDLCLPVCVCYMPVLYVCVD